MMQSSSETVGTMAAKAAPAVTIVSADLVFGYSFETWVYILTAVYLVFQIVVILPKVIQVAKRGIEYVKKRVIKSRTGDAGSTGGGDGL